MVKSYHDFARIDIFFDPSFGYHTPPEPQLFVDMNMLFHSLRIIKIYFTNKEGKAKLVDEIKDNTSAHQVHLFDACTIKSMEIEILSTHGLDRAQVFRVAVYE